MPQPLMERFIQRRSGSVAKNDPSKEDKSEMDKTKARKRKLDNTNNENDPTPTTPSTPQPTNNAPPPPTSPLGSPDSERGKRVRKPTSKIAAIEAQAKEMQARKEQRKSGSFKRPDEEGQEASHPQPPPSTLQSPKATPQAPPPSSPLLSPCDSEKEKRLRKPSLKITEIEAHAKEIQARKEHRKSGSFKGQDEEAQVSPQPEDEGKVEEIVEKQQRKSASKESDASKKAEAGKDKRKSGIIKEPNEAKEMGSKKRKKRKSVAIEEQEEDLRPSPIDQPVNDPPVKKRKSTLSKEVEETPTASSTNKKPSHKSDKPAAKSTDVIAACNDGESADSSGQKLHRSIKGSLSAIPERSVQSLKSADAKESVNRVEIVQAKRSIPAKESPVSFRAEETPASSREKKVTFTKRKTYFEEEEEEEEAPSEETEDETISRLLRTNKISRIQLNNQQGGTVYECVECNKQLYSNPLVLTHVKTHEGDRRFVCKICFRGFNASSTLARHKAVHTDDKPFQCKLCNAAFGRNSTLRAHMTTHDKVKRHTCPICQRGFHQKGNLRSHVFTHTGEKPYQCTLCNTGFNQATNLTKHLSTQHGIDSSTCRKCGEEFDTKENLMKHLEIVHNMAQKEAPPKKKKPAPRRFSLDSKSARRSINDSNRSLKSRRASTANVIPGWNRPDFDSRSNSSFNDAAISGDSNDTFPGADYQKDLGEPHSSFFANVLVLHRNVLKLVSLSKQDRDDLDSIKLTLPGGKTTAINIPARISGIKVPNEEMMYQVEITNPLVKEEVKDDPFADGFMQDSMTEEVDLDALTDNKILPPSQRMNAAAKEAAALPPLQQLDTFIKEEPEDYDDEAAALPPLQQLDTFIKEEPEDYDDEEDDYSDEVEEVPDYGWNSSFMSL